MSVTIFRAAWFVLLVLYLILWVRALLVIARTPDDAFRRGGAIGWAAVVLSLPIVGLIAYHALGSPPREHPRERSSDA